MKHGWAPLHDMRSDGVNAARELDDIHRMMPRHAFRALLFTALLAAAPVMLSATPIHEGEAGGLGGQPPALGTNTIAVDQAVTDPQSPFALNTTSALEEQPLALIQEASLDSGTYPDSGTNHGTGFLWAFALTGCGALGLAAFRSNEG